MWAILGCIGLFTTAAKDVDEKDEAIAGQMERIEELEKELSQLRGE